jgi:hypothetical protein
MMALTSPANTTQNSISTCLMYLQANFLVGNWLLVANSCLDANSGTKAM